MVAVSIRSALASARSGGADGLSGRGGQANRLNLATRPYGDRAATFSISSALSPPRPADPEERQQPVRPFWERTVDAGLDWLVHTVEELSKCRVPSSGRC